MGHSHWDIDGTFLKDLFCKCPTGKGSRFQRWRGLRSRYAYLCSVGHGTQTQNFIAGETPRARNARGTGPPLEGPKMVRGDAVWHVNVFVSFSITFSPYLLGRPQCLRDRRTHFTGQQVRRHLVRKLEITQRWRCLLSVTKPHQ